MSTLFASLNAAGGALRVFQGAIGVTQNNTVNASTPGYAKQSPVLTADQFEPSAGLTGGVSDAGVQDGRSRYAEQQVWRQQQSLGAAGARVSAYSSLESEFDISGSTGIAASLTALYQGFSSWSTTPSSLSARQSVISQAQDVASSFQQTAQAIGTAAGDADQEISGAVQQVNDLTSQIRDLNVQIQQSSEPDAGLNAQMYSHLEDLSKLVDFTPLYQPDGTVTVLAGGQVPLVMGDSSQELKSTDTATMSLLTGGKLGGWLSVRNGTLADLPAELNRLATGFADRVNSVLTSAGQTSPLFSYDASNPAGTLAVTSGLTASDLLTSDTSSSSTTSNGAPLALASMADGQDSADQLDGMSFLDFYSSLAARVGRDSSTAQNDQDQGTQQVAQAQNLRTQVSGVSLDEEATHLLQWQNSYQANSQVVSIINTLSTDLMNMFTAG